MRLEVAIIHRIVKQPMGTATTRKSVLDHRWRRTLGITLANVAALGTIASLVAIRVRQNLIVTPFDTSIVVSLAVLLGQVNVVVLLFAMLEPRSMRRWPGIFIVGAIVSTMGVATYRWLQGYPWIWSEEIEVLLALFMISLSTFVGFFLVIRVAWWPLHQISSCSIEFGDQPSELSSQHYSLSELLCWTGAFAGTCALLASFRGTYLPTIVLAVLLPVVATLPVGVTAMMAGLSCSKWRWAILLGTVFLMSVLEIIIVPLLIGPRQTTLTIIGMLRYVLTAVPVLNVVLATTVFVNFYWLRLEGMRLVRYERLSGNAEAAGV